VEGDAQVAGELLKMPFDHIFFTGSPAVGKIVMRAAAENLTSVTLELGGKSPAIVYDRADVADAARKIAWGKLVNNGQTCIAPDYLFVDEKIAADFIKAFQEAVTSYYNPEGKGIAASDSYARIINTRHFNRLQGLVQDALDSGAQVLMGGTHDPEQRFFHPTLLGNVAHGARIMEEEIFGPILPLFTFKDPKEAYETIAGKPKPLALYLFTKDRQQAEAGLAFTTAGGTCINDTLIHFTNPDLPFGGVNNSGIGKSHGYYSFQAFSNERAVIRQRTGLTTLSPIYPPYNGKVKKMVDLMLKWL
jgi:aldehyde dehydrogenase (NAD+)